ncbi:MAG: NYN domain-containing protein [Hyphomicrobiales bacterium]
MNIFPRRKEPAEAAPDPTIEPHPEPSPEALEETQKRTRRGSRGARGRSRAPKPKVEAADEETVAAVLANSPEVEASDEAVEPEPVAAEPEAEPVAPRKRAPRRSAVAKAEVPAEEPETREEPAPQPKPASRTRARRSDKPAAEPAEVAPPENGSTAAILRALEQQNRQIEHLLRVQEDLARKLSSVGSHPATRPPRVGVFVDAANIELACDRLRARFDWAKVLKMLTQDRELVRAMAYSPVHDDPNVSMETQRFAEPFLDKGFKIVAKPLKRFADGTIKANVDIEMALDVISMLDRLDVVCLVSGDGDFQPLVEFVQRHGVRCEVVAVGASTANNLRHAADQYIDLQHRLREIRA